ncbi:helix-turn-helix domain-containing protein [Enterococcus sp. JM9B]|uniref:helix-turn-helix domain-containing protein n=1 Tax=Enterococcus sp. JM9B TaxID=1857216 RepID=UPI001374A460|nr:helix-turn-helix domain-containing protein [Enterococcus sp. JM9B]
MKNDKEERIKDIARRLKKLRLENGWSKVEVARKIGVTGGAYSNWEYATKQPSIESLEKLSDVFNVSVSFLLNGTLTFEEAEQLAKEQQEEGYQAALETDVNNSELLKLVKDYIEESINANHEALDLLEKELKSSFESLNTLISPTKEENQSELFLKLTNHLLNVISEAGYIAELKNGDVLDFGTFEKEYPKEIFNIIDLLISKNNK